MRFHIGIQMILKAGTPVSRILSDGCPEKLRIQAEIKVGNGITGIQNAVQICGKLCSVQNGVGGNKSIDSAEGRKIFFPKLTGGMHGKKNGFVIFFGQPYKIIIHSAIVCLRIIT